MRNIYTDGQYSAHNPTWHEEDSSWKALQVRRMLKRHSLSLHSIAEIGCGVGGVLAQLREMLPGDFEFSGFDIAASAIERARQRECERLHYYAEDLLQREICFDLLLIMDVVEHISDYMTFLAGCRSKAKFKIYHIPLDIHVSSVIRGTMITSRSSVGHLHYFTAESALATLKDTGHHVIDSFYTDGGLALASSHPSLKRTLANIPRRLISTVSTAWAARLLGGYSLLVLAE